MNQYTFIAALFLFGATTFTPLSLFTDHKSPGEIARMTSQQLVEEYCDEYARHGDNDTEYRHLLEQYIIKDLSQALPPLIQIIDSYDSTLKGKKKLKHTWRFKAAAYLLAQIDDTIKRLRSTSEGRQAILAIKNAFGKMKQAKFDISDEFEDRNNYDIMVSIVNELEGSSFCDLAIRDTLRVKYQAVLLDTEMKEFINYLISQNPSYPSQCERELYRDESDRNEAGNPAQLSVLKNGEPIYKVYVQYKTMQRQIGHDK